MPGLRVIPMARPIRSSRKNRTPGGCTICTATSGNGAWITGITATQKNRQSASRTEVFHGYLAMERSPGCCAVVPGTSMLGLVALPAATPTIPILVTSTSVFGWCAVLPGLCSALLFSAFVLFSLVFTLCRPFGAGFKILKIVFHNPITIS